MSKKRRRELHWCSGASFDSSRLEHLRKCCCFFFFFFLLLLRQHLFWHQQIHIDAQTHLEGLDVAKRERRTEKEGDVTEISSVPSCFAVGVAWMNSAGELRTPDEWMFLTLVALTNCASLLSTDALVSSNVLSFPGMFSLDGDPWSCLVNTGVEGCL